VFFIFSDTGGGGGKINNREIKIENGTKAIAASVRPFITQTRLLRKRGRRVVCGRGGAPVNGMAITPFRGAGSFDYAQEPHYLPPGCLCTRSRRVFQILVKTNIVCQDLLL
jgi:hypothetical protein